MQSAGRLKYERMQRGWSQARVAESIGTDAGNVSRWERGRSSPSPYFRERLCQLYEKTAQELGLWMEEPPESGEGGAGASDRDSGSLTLWVGETLPLDCTDARQAEVVPTVSSRVLASLSYVLGWLTGLLVLLFHRSNRFVLLVN